MIDESNAPSVVLLIGEDTFTRLGLRTSIQNCGPFVVCGEAATIDAALETLDHSDPDLVVVDLSARNGMGLGLIQRIREQWPNVRLVVISMLDDVFYAGQVLALGASMYWNKRGSLEAFTKAFRQVAGGGKYVSEEIAQQLLFPSAGSQNAGTRSLASLLTPRELQVFELIGQGLNTKKIAKRMGIRANTVDTYRERIRAKIGSNDGAELNFRAIAWSLLNS